MSPAEPEWWLILMISAGLIAGAVLPVFFFSLYRYRGALFIPPKTRRVGLLAAILLSLLMAANLRLELLDLAFASHGGLLHPKDWVIGHAVGLIGLISDAALILLLLSFYFHRDRESHADDAHEHLLDQTTKIAVILYGLFLAFLAVRILVSPLVYSSFKEVALQSGRALPPYLAMLGEELHDFATQACVFAAPYVIFRRRLKDVANESIPAPPDERSDAQASIDQ